MNFIYIAPQNSNDQWNYCAQLKNNGVTVLGIGQTVYDFMPTGLKHALTEYYRVDDLHDYEQMKAAVLFLQEKYGAIDWLESNQRILLKQDARLRKEFKVKNGLMPGQERDLTFLPKVLERCKEAGMRTMPYQLVTGKRASIAFAEQYGYPIRVHVTKDATEEQEFFLDTRSDLLEFLEYKPQGKRFLMPGLAGDIYTYDAIVNGKEEPFFETGMVISRQENSLEPIRRRNCFYVEPNIEPAIKELGRTAVKVCGIKSRFIHFEWLHLRHRVVGVGRKGDFVLIGASIVPRNGIYPDMFNYAKSVDVHKLWADMIAFDRKVGIDYPEKFYCAYAARVDTVSYRRKHPEVLSQFRTNIMMSDRVQTPLTEMMGNQMYLAKFTNQEDMEAFFAYVLEPSEH